MSAGVGVLVLVAQTFRSALRAAIRPGLALVLLLAPGPAPSSAQNQGRARSREDLSVHLPPGTGKELVAKQCATCHDLGGVIQLRKPREAWEALVLDMVARGAPLMLEEVDPIIGYLAEAFGPKAPPLVDVNSANKEDLVRLPGVTAEAADRLVAHRASQGPLSTADEVRGVLGMDAQAFDRVKYYIRTTLEPKAR